MMLMKALCILLGTAILSIAAKPSPYDEIAWSPDGEWITFRSYWIDNWEIFKMRADGSNLQQLTDNPAWDAMPAWSPDGQWIAFISSREGNYTLYKMRPDGSDMQRLTDPQQNVQMFSWSPSAPPLPSMTIVFATSIGLITISGTFLLHPIVAPHRQESPT